MSSQKIPLKAETRALKQALTAGSYENISPPDSPFINRRPISQSTEAALRAACTAIVNATQLPDDDAVLVAKVPDIDHASTTHTTGKHSRKDSRPKVLEGPVLAHPTKYTYRPDTALQDLFPVSSKERKLMQTQTQQVQAQQNIPRRSESLQPKCKTTEKTAMARINSMPEEHASDLEVTSPVERPKTAPIAESSDVSVSTPVSASTDRMPNLASTALTTAAVTPSRPSERGSQQFVADNDQHQTIVEQVDAAAVEWMRRELEKRRQRQDREAQTVQTTQPVQRAPSRTGPSRGRSLSNGIRDYIRPRTASNSRPPSRGGGQGSESTGVSRVPSWRSWGLQRKSSKTSITDARIDPSSSQPDLRTNKKDVDLNRPLPALPSLETWKETCKDPASSKTSTGTHIANLMRPKSSRDRDVPKETAQARVINIQKVKVVPQSLPKLKTESPTAPLAPPKPRYEVVAGEDSSPSTKSYRFISHSKSSSQDSCFSPASSGYLSKRSMDLVKAAERARSKSQENMNGRARRDSTTSSSTQPQRARAPSIASVPRKVSFSTANYNPNGTASLPRSSSSRPATRAGTTTSAAAAAAAAAQAAAAGENTPNFSRKFSSDFHHFGGRIFDPRQANVIEITALPPMPPKNKGSLASLRRIVSQFSLGRDGGSTAKKKDSTWTDYAEKDGPGVGLRSIMKGGAGRESGQVPVRF